MLTYFKKLIGMNKIYNKKDLKLDLKFNFRKKILLTFIVFLVIK